MHWSPVFKRTVEDGEVVALTLGHALVDDYLGFVAARAEPNTLLATAFDLKVFFSVVEKDPAQVTSADVFTFLKSQRTSYQEAKIVRLEDGERRHQPKSRAAVGPISRRPVPLMPRRRFGTWS